MKRIMPIRKAIGRRTIFNLMGPLANPARVTRQLVGIARPAYVPVYAEALHRLGTDHSRVISGDEGLDELSLAGGNEVAVVTPEGVRMLRSTAADAGLPARSLAEIRGGDAFGALGAAGFVWVNMAALVGGLYLLARGIVRWQIPAAVLAGLALPAALAHAVDPGANPGAVFHLFSGATMLCAFFIATDPVSAATSDRGRLVYGAGIGLRYRTPIGPVRFDIGYSINPPRFVGQVAGPGGDLVPQVQRISHVQFHFSVGQTF